MGDLIVKEKLEIVNDEMRYVILAIGRVKVSLKANLAIHP